MARLEELVRRIESNETGIDQLAGELKEAQRLVAFCREKLYATDEEIKKIFWSDKSNNDPRLHNAISRLRRVFENVPSIEIQRYENIGYQLQIRRNK